MPFRKNSSFKMPSLKKGIEWKSLLGRNPRKFILPGAGILVSLFIIFFIFFPGLKKIRLLKESITVNELRLKELSSLSKRYMELKELNSEIDGKISKKGARFEILSFLEEMAKKTGIGNKLSSMKPTEAEPNEFSVSVVLRNLDLEELTDFLYQIVYSGKVISIKKMHLRILDRGQKSLEASLIVSTPKSPQEKSSS